MRKQLIIMFAAILTFSSYPMIHAHAQQIDIGDPETHSDYYWYGNLTVQRNESLSIINEIFFIYGRSLNVNGTLSVQNSTLILNNTEISITRGTFIIGNSSVEGNGSITMDASTFRSFNSTVFDGYAGTFSAFNSSVYILRSNISGQSTSDEFNYTMARYYNNSYQPGGQVSLKMENYSHGYAYRLNISVEYEYANASHPASIYVVYENESQYLHLSASTTMTTSYFTFILQRPSANPLPEIYVYSNESDLEVYNITALAIANDTYYLYGSQHYDLYLSNSIMYSVDSKFDLNDRPLYLDDGLISPYATGKYLYHSAAYMVSSGSGIANITRIPFISSASIVYYMSAVNITYLLDGRSYDYNGSVYYANGQAIDLNSTVSALSRYVYYSTSVHEVPVWIFNGTITYKGNYEIDVYGRMEYFSISPYPYLSNVLQTFVGSVTIPQLNITIPGVLYTGTDQTISIGYKSSYAGISNAYIDVHLINGSESILIFRIHIMNLSADSTRNATENLNLSISPGMYQAYFTTNSSDIIFIDQYVNVVVEDHVNLTMRWYYRYTLPFHDLKFDLSMFDASGDPAEGGLQMYFLSGNSTAISKNTFIHVSPSSYDNLTVFANSSKNLTSVFVGLRYNESMFNYIPNQTAKIRLRPIFSNYDVKF
ncbi:MAG: hypothetical protein OWQ34_06480, partial [Thermoplasma acidophilum]|nr:hypothetical protein [Thermoplasma acidophilum]